MDDAAPTHGAVTRQRPAMAAALGGGALPPPSEPFPLATGELQRVLQPLLAVAVLVH